MLNGDKILKVFSDSIIFSTKGEFDFVDLSKEVDKIIKEINEFQEEQEDDMTLVVVKKIPER